MKKKLKGNGNIIKRNAEKKRRMERHERKDDGKLNGNERNEMKEKKNNGKNEKPIQWT